MTASFTEDAAGSAKAPASALAARYLRYRPNSPGCRSASIATLAIHRRSARAGRIHTRSSGLRKRRHRSPLHAQAHTQSTFHLFLRAPHASLCENVDLACLTSVCDAEQLNTDAALVLDASTRVAAAPGCTSTQSTFPLSPRTSHTLRER